MMTGKPDFEQSFQELQQIVQRLEGGQLELEQMLESFEKGVGLIRRCRGMLDQAQTRIQELVEIDDAGNARLRDFEHEASVAKKAKAETKAQSRPEQQQTDEDLLF